MRFGPARLHVIFEVKSITFPRGKLQRSWMRSTVGRGCCSRQKSSKCPRPLPDLLTDFNSGGMGYYIYGSLPGVIISVARTRVSENMLGKPIICPNIAAKGAPPNANRPSGKTATHLYGKRSYTSGSSYPKPNPNIFKSGNPMPRGDYGRQSG